MKNKNGVTLISLTVTILILILLSSITFRIGTDAYTATLTKTFIGQMKVIQGKVDVLVENSNLDTSKFIKLSSLSTQNSESPLFQDYELFEDIISHPENYNIDTNISWDDNLDTDIENYYYFNPEIFEKKLGLKDQKFTVIINFTTRNIISKTSVMKNDEEYFRLYDLENTQILN